MTDLSNEQTEVLTVENKPTSGDKAIDDRIAARAYAEEVWTFVLEEKAKQADPNAFWGRIIEILKRDVGLAYPDKPMKEVIPFTDKQVKSFENQTIPFGAYKGNKIGEVELSYLCNLTDPSPFIQDIKRYLLNPEVKRRIQES